VLVAAQQALDLGGGDGQDGGDEGLIQGADFGVLLAHLVVGAANFVD